MELDEVLLALHRSEPITESLAAEILRHTTTLSSSLGDNFATLKAILERHEALIRSRWRGKSPAQRKKILLNVWPNMPPNHRPDYDASLDSSLDIDDPASRLEGHILWPYINLEDLSKPQSLLIFLNARGRNLPWTFAELEPQFSPLNQFPSCKGDARDLVKLNVQFTKDPAPGKYGMSVNVENRPKDRSNINAEFFEYCPKQGLQLLKIQERIMNFLVTCSEAILHVEKNDGPLTEGPIKPEPDSTELAQKHAIGYATFADGIMLAPYRARNTIDFCRLKAYVSALLNNARDHVWSMREDPLYMAEAIKQTAEHRGEMAQDGFGHTHPIVGKPVHIKNVTTQTIHEAYEMLASLDGLYRSVHDLSERFQDGIVRDLHENFHAVMAFRKYATFVRDILTTKLRLYTWGLPGTRHLFIRSDTDGDGSMEFKGLVPDTFSEFQLMHIFKYFNVKPQSRRYDSILYLLLDRLDILTRTDNAAKGMLSSCISEFLTQLSVITECLFQVEMWLGTPEVNLFGESHQDCKAQLEDDILIPFFDWIETAWKLTPLISLVYPARGKVDYPIYKARNEDNVNKLRHAEAQLDTFWRHIDSSFEKRTGVAQHKAIEQYLIGEMRRTAPYSQSFTPREKPELVYVPLSRLIHDEAKQITGTFNKCSVVEKPKHKTRGNVGLLTPDHSQGEETSGDEQNEANPSTIFHLDKRAYKVFKTIFGMHDSDTDELPKIIKWEEFTRAMVRTGFSAEKLQGSAWQFTPVGDTVGVERAVQFHEPHPDSDISYVIARRFGRRLERVYGWSGETFRLA